MKFVPVKIVESGRSPEILCKARGWPTPRTSWWRNGLQIRDGDYHHSYRVKHLADNTVTLLIVAIEGYHHGTHTCRADNLFGTSVADITFMVKRKYTIPSIYDSLTVDLNMSSRPWLPWRLFIYLFQIIGYYLRELAPRNVYHLKLILMSNV